MPLQTVTRTVPLCLALLAPGGVLADAIDGAWCAPDGSDRVTVAGSEITLGSGTVVTGRYTRHEVVYTVPDGMPDAGVQIHMRQLSEQDVEVFRDTDPSVRWQRCQAVVS